MKVIVTMLLACVVAAASAATVPAGAEFVIRLKTPVSSAHSKPGDPVSAVLIQSLTSDSKALPPGTEFRGAVRDAERKRKADGRAILETAFDSVTVAGAALPIATRVVNVDNARETVDDTGAIHGLAPLKKKPAKVEDLLLLAAHAHPIVLGALEATKLIVAHATRPEINYHAGTEMRLRLIKPLDTLAGTPPVDLGSEPAPDKDLMKLVAQQPLRTTARRPPAPSDLTNILLIGTADNISMAFHESGWLTADVLSIRSDAKTFLAVADRHSYRQGPFSLLLLEGKPPDLVFQKQLDTFSKRHHIRLWRRPDTHDGARVWVGAATHDVAIRFSRQARTFTHQVDTRIDLERDKVVADLRFSGHVSWIAYVERPSAPKALNNATGDNLETDGRIGVLRLR